MLDVTCFDMSFEHPYYDMMEFVQEVQSKFILFIVYGCDFFNAFFFLVVPNEIATAATAFINDR